MATPRPSAATTNRTPLFLLLGLIAAIALASLIYLHRSSPTPVAASEPTAATQPDVAPTRILPKNHIYSETADPKSEIAAALTQARREHKRVLLDFGGDWCGDCQVLDLYFHQPPNADLLAQNFILVHVFIGRMDKNLDIPLKYNVPLNKGVPALAVLDPSGKVLYSQTAGEFENMRNMDPNSVTGFLNRWKA